VSRFIYCYAECHHPDCHYAVIMWSVVMLSVVVPNKMPVAQTVAILTLAPWVLQQPILDNLV